MASVVSCTMLPARPPLKVVNTVTSRPCACRAAEGPAIVAAAAVAATAAAPAKAANVDTVVNSTVDSTVSQIESFGSILKGLYSKGVEVAGAAGDAYDKVSPQINSAIDTAVPVLKKGVDEVGKVAGPAFNKAAPIVQAEGSKFLKGSGVDTDALQSSTNAAADKAGQAYSAASPWLNKAYTFLTTSEPETLAKGGAILVGSYYLLPVVLKLAVGSLRGFSGELSPAKAVDMVTSQDDAVIIDLRSAKEKAATGVPDIPGSAKGRFLELEGAQIERRLRGQLRSAESVECQITAIEVRALKRVNKSTTLLLIDRNGSFSKDVAKTLAGMGFRKVYVVSGGFLNWTACKLQTRAPVPGAAQSNGIIPNIIGTINTRKDKLVSKASK